MKTYQRLIVLPVAFMFALLFASLVTATQTVDFKGFGGVWAVAGVLVPAILCISGARTTFFKWSDPFQDTIGVLAWFLILILTV